jgi:uncharacterized membrane protein YkvA (DUF1232 family)
MVRNAAQRRLALSGTHLREINSMTRTDKLRIWAQDLKRDSVTLWFAAKSPSTPWYAKALGLFVVAYALSPIDLIPDFIPVLGYVDDVLLLPALIWLAVKWLPAHVLQDCRRQADAWMQAQGRKPRSRAGVVLVVAVWMVAIGLIYRALSSG